MGPHEFGTYNRDSFTGLDYADQRFYASSYGRFNTRDRIGGGVAEPGSWNRYSYTRGDPVNRTDFAGLCDSDFCATGTAYADRDAMPGNREALGAEAGMAEIDRSEGEHGSPRISPRTAEP
jgi:RHS repeat-associated protein